MGKAGGSLQLLSKKFSSKDSSKLSDKLSNKFFKSIIPPPISIPHPKQFQFPSSSLRNIPPKKPLKHFKAILTR
jgi:hypothetical protein